MAKTTTRYLCRLCGAASQSWSGKCYECGEWNTLEEDESVELSQAGAKQTGKKIKTEPVDQAAKHDEKRLPTNISEADNVLGGGLVPGSVVLLAGQPGIGKSTLLMQLAHNLSKSQTVLYVSGEESSHQVGQRAKRLGASGESMKIATSTSAEDIAATILSKEYAIVVVDSVQAISCGSSGAGAGSVTQISASTSLLVAAAKSSNTALVVVGHVTKEGSIAGPKVLEHVVDVVLQLEGDRYGGFKVLRAVKNRYGSTQEAGIFEMKDNGLHPVGNPSAALLGERQASDGSIVLATLEGTRPLLVEVQSLVNRTSYGYPKRTASGIDLNRVNLLIAMLEKRTKLNLAEQDIYINVVGGIRLQDPAADLAVCMAIASAAKGMQLKQNAVVFGEVGLSGEVRSVMFADKRVAEAKKLGFDTCIGPAHTRTKLPGYYGVKDVRSALNEFLGK